MPNYKTHSVHGEIILEEVLKHTEIKKEDMKTYCMGPDAMIATDYKLFEYQHANKTKDFFIALLNYIKENKLQENSEVMAYLYGNIDHFVLDAIIHPLIYYKTKDLKLPYRINAHGLIEMWTDDYIVKKYDKKILEYYKKSGINDEKLKQVIDDVYNNIYGRKHQSLRYNLGIKTINLFDDIVRSDKIQVLKSLIDYLKLGDVTYKTQIERIKPFLNLNKDKWYNPETNEEYKDSFDELWNKSIEVTLETIEDINKFLYNDKELKNPLILNNISYNTGLPCEKGQQLKYVKKY